VTRERDRLKNSQELNEAEWRRQVKRLEEQLEQANERGGSGQLHKVGVVGSCVCVRERRLAGTACN